MTRVWIATKSLLLCFLIAWSCAFPLQRNPGGDQDSDEVDSDEDERSSSTTRQGIQNVTDQELTNKATQFLTNYFNNHGTEIPLHIPTNLNHTIVITVVPNNASSSAYENLGTVSPVFGGDLPLFSSQQQQYLQQQQFQQLKQIEQQQQIQQQLEIQRQQQILQQQQAVNLTPIKDLFGFVRQEQLAPVVTREGVEHPKRDIISPSSSSNIATTTTTTSTTTTPTIATPTAPPPVKEQPVDNIEDAILEALSIAGGEGGQGASPTAASSSSASSPSSQANNNFQALIDSGAIPGLTSSNNNGVIKVPSHFGPVFIQAGVQPTQPSGATVFVNSNTPAPPAAAPPLQPNLIFLQHLIPPPSSNVNENAGTQQRPQSAAINAVSGIIGSISQGNLGGIVQNSIKLAETPAVQNTAKLATVAILHNVFQGLNPCNFLGNCRPRPAALKKT